jgi:uncharacterized membrane protein YphA (DoxX/SURF4 family)
MPKEEKHAAVICIGLSILAGIGIAAGVFTKYALITVICLLPAVAYEVYRTEGVVTKLASLCILVILIAEIFFVATGRNFDVTKFVGGAAQQLGRYNLPLGDIKVVGPIVTAVLSFILFRRTYGIYTRWLAVVILVTSIGIIYVVNPGIIQQLIERVRGVKM